MTKNELLQEFQKALQASTSGSQGMRVLKILYEQMPDMSNSEMFQEVEQIAGEMTNYDHSEFLIKMLKERFELLVSDCVRSRQMEIDHQREMLWESPFWRDDRIEE